MPLAGGEGPIGLVLCPARELARQTYEVVEYYMEALAQAGFPRLRSTLCIGGEDKRKQIDVARTRGIHCVVATPGRLNDLLNQGLLNMDLCKYFCLDEGDRMLDLGFDEEVHNIINRLSSLLKTLLLIHLTSPHLTALHLAGSHTNDKPYCSRPLCPKSSKTLQKIPLLGRSWSMSVGQELPIWMLYKKWSMLRRRPKSFTCTVYSSL